MHTHVDGGEVVVSLNEVEAEALSDLVQERAEQIQDKRNQDAADAQAAIDLAKRQRALRKQAVQAIKTRNEMVPIFLAALLETAKLAKELSAARDSYVEAVAYSMKLGGSTGTAYPRQFGIDPAEREALRSALTALQSVGGVV
jgi:DNA primase large subunit